MVNSSWWGVSSALKVQLKRAVAAMATIEFGLRNRAWGRDNDSGIPRIYCSEAATCLRGIWWGTLERAPRQDSNQPLANSATPNRCKDTRSDFDYLSTSGKKHVGYFKGGIMRIGYTNQALMVLAVSSIAVAAISGADTATDT